MALDDDPVEVYRREIASISPLTKEEEAHLFQEARQSGEREDAKRRLIENYLYLVLPIAERRHSSSGLSTLELIHVFRRADLRLEDLE